MSASSVVQKNVSSDQVLSRLVYHYILQKKILHKKKFQSQDFILKQIRGANVEAEVRPKLKA